jgi:hypothetical protein
MKANRRSIVSNSVCVNLTFNAATDLIGNVTSPRDFVVCGGAEEEMFGGCEAYWRPEMVRPSYTCLMYPLTDRRRDVRGNIASFTRWSRARGEQRLGLRRVHRHRETCTLWLYFSRQFTRVTRLQTTVKVLKARMD